MHNPKDTATKKAERDFRKALLKLMQSKNFSEITVSELCKTAELSRGTFYRYYTNTNDLLQDYIQEIFNNYTKDCDNIKYTSNDLKSGIFARCKVYYNHISVNRNFYTIMLGEHGIKNFQETLQNIRVKKFLKRYSLKNNNDDNYTKNIHFILLAQYITYAQLGLARYWLTGKMMVDIDTVSAIAADYTYCLLTNYKDDLLINLH